MTDAPTLIRDAQDKAERLCALAVEQTPAPYQSFITLIEQRRKVGGSRPAPIFATVRQPYLSVDGRVKWARDEHLRAGTRFDVQTEFVVEPTSGQLLARATLTSEIYGTGIASAEEVLRVAERPESSATAASRPDPCEPGPAPPPAIPPGLGLPDETTEAELIRLGQALGLRPGELALRRAQAPSDGDALIALRTEVAARVRSEETTREALLAHAAGLDPEAGAYRRYLTARYQIVDGETPECALSEAQFREERERFARRYQDAGVAEGFRDQCTRLAGAPAA